ncbi:MAG TPA: DUF6597 domain-containing transcriptional factor, partial [Longimicrobiales bacterium]|nr:DUF6597 domain-containing transcriptional factor [Longimicrobiales bacterium]
MEYGEVRPDPALARRVRCIWWMTAPPGGDGPSRAGSEGVLPDGRPELVLNFGDPFLHHRAAGAPAVTQPRAVLVGQITHPLHLEPSGRIELLGVRFHASGLHRLTGLPADELVDGWTGLEDGWAGGAELWDRVAHAGTGPIGPGSAEGRTHRWRIDVLQGLLRRALGNARGAPEPVGAAERMIRKTGGSVSMDRVAEVVELSPRQLRRRFRTEAGIGPKLLARMVRLQGFIRLAEDRPRESTARLALEAGYYDQAH